MTKHRISVEITRTACAAALLALAALPARSVELERGEWRRVGPSFACVVVAPKQLAPNAVNPDELMPACLHMGPFVIRDDAHTLASVLGAPHRTLPQPKGPPAGVWFLEQQGHYPYFVAGARNDRIATCDVDPDR
jgi:hypothetical protein